MVTKTLKQSVTHRATKPIGFTIVAVPTPCSHFFHCYRLGMNIVPTSPTPPMFPLLPLLPFNPLLPLLPLLLLLPFLPLCHSSHSCHCCYFLSQSDAEFKVIQSSLYLFSLYFVSMPVCMTQLTHLKHICVLATLGAGARAFRALLEVIDAADNSICGSNVTSTTVRTIFGAARGSIGSRRAPCANGHGRHSWGRNLLAAGRNREGG